MKPGSHRREEGAARSAARRSRGASVAIVAAAAACCTAVLAPPPARAARADLPRPAALEPAVEFWRRIFATYSEHEVVVHDAWYLGKVYEVLDFRPWYATGEPETAELAALRKARVEDAKERVRGILLRLHALGSATGPLSPEEEKIRALFRDVGDSDRYLAAAERIRAQAGLRGRFANGIVLQSRYLARMQSIFAARGLPVELARLPLVESCFDVEAYSKVGAAGVWQFMPATGRLYMRVNAAVDERRDPILATEAAAEHLARDHEVLGTWPLAITAYNHGRGGVARAVEETGTIDIGEIVQRYRGRAFGFASRNFYAEFLAALDVTERSADLFGELPVLRPLDVLEVEVERPIHLAEAARRIGTDRAELIELNPALLPAVTRGAVPIPSGYVLRVPSEAERSEVQVASALGPAAGELRLASEKSRSADRASLKAAKAATASSGRAKKGTAIASRPAAPPGSKKSAATVIVHHVAPGQTLSDIARRYGTTVAMIQGLNNLRRPRSLQAGQKLRVPRDT